MNKDIMRRVGFSKEVDAIEDGRCPFCDRKGPFDFRDELSFREFQIGGLCQRCQDDMFGDGSEEEAF